MDQPDANQTAAIHHLGRPIFDSHRRAVRPSRNGHRRWFVVVAMVIAVLLLGEVFGRVLAHRGAVPARWNIEELPQLEQQMKALGPGGADVVVVGSSVAGAGFDPSLFTPSTPGSYHSAYDAWVVGPNVTAMSFVAQHLAIPDLHPKAVVIVVTARELNDNGTSQADLWQAITTSPAYNEVLGKETFLERLGDKLGRYSALIRLRGVMRSPSAVVHTLLHGPLTAAQAALAPRGNATDYNTPLQFSAAHEAQERQALAGFHFGGRQLTQLENLVRALRREGIRPLVVNYPVLHSVYDSLFPHPGQDQKYAAALKVAMKSIHADYLDADAAGWSRSDFSDENHLNDKGRERVTAMVRQALAVPEG